MESIQNELTDTEFQHNQKEFQRIENLKCVNTLNEIEPNSKWTNV